LGSKRFREAKPLINFLFNRACPKCQGAMKIISFIEDEEVTSQPLKASLPAKQGEAAWGTNGQVAVRSRKY